MNGQLQGRVALVTGSGNGIARALACHFHAIAALHRVLPSPPSQVR